MGESIFIEPIRRWLASRSSKDPIGQALPTTTLTPEQQLAQLRGLPIEVPAPIADASPHLGDAPPNSGLPHTPTIGNEVACRECGQGCAPDAVFCPFCATVLVPPPPVGMQAANNTPPLEISGLKCARCGEECPEGYELCANCTRLDLQPELGDESNPVMKRVSIGNGDSGTSGEDQEQPAIHVQQVDSDSNTDGESPNVTMAESLRSIFSGQSVINQDTVAFLERHGTIGTDELLAELRSLHRALR